MLRKPGGEGRPPAEPMAIAAANDGRAKGSAPHGQQQPEHQEAESSQASLGTWGEADALKLECRESPPRNPFESLLRAKAAERGQVLRLRDQG